MVPAQIVLLATTALATTIHTRAVLENTALHPQVIATTAPAATTVFIQQSVTRATNALLESPRQTIHTATVIQK